MTLKRQLLFVSLLTLMLPWAGCQFVRETESALRASQQQNLAGVAELTAERFAQNSEEFPLRVESDHVMGDQLYGHPLEAEPVIDGYMDDWTIGDDALREMQGTDGLIRFAIGLSEQYAYLFVYADDDTIVYADSASLIPRRSGPHADRITLISNNPPYLEQDLLFAAEAPGALVTYVRNNVGFAPEPTIRAWWQDRPKGYQLEARIPRNQLGTHLGLIVHNTDSRDSAGIRSSSFAARMPGAFVSVSPELSEIAASLVQPGMRLLLTDASGWRVATAGALDGDARDEQPSGWARLTYDLLVEAGTESAFAEPNPSGREQQPYIASALDGRSDADWFRSPDDGRAIVAVAQPVMSGGNTIGAVVLQQGTDAILSLTNEGLARLLNVSLIAMFVVGGVLLGYATWLSRRIRRLSVAAEDAMLSDDLRTALPSAEASDEIGDLSRSFSNVLQQLGDYNEYLRTLASKLSHELRTPLAIVTSSLENLEHEDLTVASAGYTQRAREGADRLRRILRAMSEASRVEELIKDAEPEVFDLESIISSSVDAYRDVYPDRRFVLERGEGEYSMRGSPELIIQMLDKFVDNAVSFSQPDDEVSLQIANDGEQLRIDVSNPGPQLPERMRAQMFDSMVSVRPG